jgi:hypothetical protein
MNVNQMLCGVQDLPYRFQGTGHSNSTAASNRRGQAIACPQGSALLSADRLFQVVYLNVAAANRHELDRIGRLRWLVRIVRLPSVYLAAQ